MGRTCPVKAGNWTGMSSWCMQQTWCMRAASLQQRLEKKGTFIFSSSHLSALPSNSTQLLNTQTLEADSFCSHSGLHDLEGAGSREGRREDEGRSRPWGLPFHLLPSRGPWILNSSQAWAGWTTLDLSTLARGQNEFHGVLVCLQDLQGYGIHLGSPWALRWAVGRAELRQSWRSACFVCASIKFSLGSSLLHIYFAFFNDAFYASLPRASGINTFTAGLLIIVKKKWEQSKLNKSLLN